MPNGNEELARCIAECTRYANDPVNYQRCIDDCHSRFDKVVACINGICKEAVRDTVQKAQIEACSGMTVGSECGRRRGCKNDEECGEGYYCADIDPTTGMGKCKAKEEAQFDCPGGSDDECPEGYSCVDGKCIQGTGEQCDPPCGPGEKCVSGQCVPEGTADCPQGNFFDISAEESCPSGYVKISRPRQNKYRCECSAWCLTVGYEADCKTRKGEGDLDYWQPGEDLQAIIEMILQRIEELFGYETGLGAEEYQMLLNRLRRDVKASERGRMESLTERMADLGILGTGMELAEYEKEAKSTRDIISDLETQVALDQALRKYEQFLGTTGAAQSLFGTALGVEQLEEILNAARRGEGRQDMSMMLALLTTLMGAEANNPYWQAVINSMITNQGGSDYSYLSWLPYLLM